MLLALTLMLQVRSGAHESDFGGHPDEAAHVVTGLMVRDYLAGPFWSGTHPMRYAEDYYERFPRVALGHYPPGFYVVEALWLLPSRTATAALLLPVFLTSLTAWIIFMVGRRLMRPPAAVVAAAAFPLMHLVQVYTAIVMSDMLLVIWCLLAALAFGRFLETGGAKWSLAFGLLAAAAILTKGSGLLLALVPPVAIVLTARWKVLLAPKLWLAPLPVLFLAVPWLVLTAHITAEGMAAEPAGDYFLKAVPYYLTNAVSVLGVMLIVLTGAALVVAAIVFKREKGLPAKEAVLWALVVAVLAFYCVVPSGLDERYLLPVIPSALALGFSALDRFGLRMGARYPGFPVAALPLLAALAVVLETGSPAVKAFQGQTRALAGLLRDSDEPLALLVCSDSSGEGALIASAALLAPDRVVVERGTKLLSTSDWMGRGYKANFSSDEELFGLLDKAGVTHVIVDGVVPGKAIWPHQHAIDRVIRERQDHFPRVTQAASRRRETTGKLTIAKFESIGKETRDEPTGGEIIPPFPGGGESIPAPAKD